MKLFAKNFIIQIPEPLRLDKRFTWTERIYFFFLSDPAFNSNTEKLMAEFGKTDRQLRRMKQKLALHGYLTRIEENKQVRYLPLDIDGMWLERFKRFIPISTVGFVNLSEPEIMLLQSAYQIQLVYMGTSLLEQQYRQSPQKIGKPYPFLKRTLRKLDVPSSFNADWWIEEADKKAEKEKKTALQDYRDSKAAESEAMKELNFERYFKALPKEKQEQLEKEARDKIMEEQGPFMSYVSKRMEHYIVMAKIMEIMEVKHAATGTA